MELVQIIRQAFAEIQPLSPKDFSGEELEAERALGLCEGKPWWDINPIALTPTEAGFLSEPVLLYLLPAYMTAALDCDWIDVTTLLDILYTRDTPWEPIFGRDWWHADFTKWDHLMKRLTAEQKHAIRLWLEALREKYPKRQTTTGERWQERIQFMLANSWNQY